MTVSKVIYFGQEKCPSEPRRVHSTKGDGNCFFRCISYALTGDESSHLSLHDIVVNHMLDLGNKVEDYLNENVSGYLAATSMARNGVWATDAVQTVTNTRGHLLFSNDSTGSQLNLAVSSKLPL